MMDKRMRQDMIEQFIKDNMDNPEKYRVVPPAPESEVMMTFKQRDELRRERRKQERLNKKASEKIFLDK